MTDAQKGNLFLVKAATKYNGSTYATVAALRSNGITINNAPVDITNKDGNGWQEMMAGGGVKSVSVTGEGVYTDSVTQQRVQDGIMGKIKATGTVTFDDNPANGETIELNGVQWTFVTSGASGEETNIGGTLGDTLDQLVIDLNVSVDADLAVATYTGDSIDTLTIEYDTVGVIGNAYTLVEETAEVVLSAATLTGGMNQDQHWNYQVIDEAGNVFEGPFNVDSYELAGDANAETSYSFTLSSAGEVTFTPA
jgi:predicted secreted protein